MLWAKLLACGLCACQSEGPNAEPAGASATSSAADAQPRARVGLIPQRQTPIADLPVPIGFKLAESISRDFESAGVRFVDHTYVGRDDKFEVERFYSEQMPQHGWVFQSKRMVRGDITLRYDKGQESAEVRIADASGLTTNRTSVQITIQRQGAEGAPAAG